MYPEAVHVQDAQGVTPLEMLDEYRRDDWKAAVIQELPSRVTSCFSRPDNPPSVFHQCGQTLKEWPQALAQLQSEPSLATVKDSDRMLPLHWAALNGAPVDVVDVLLAAYPAATAAKCIYGRLPLHYAIIGRASQDVVAAS